MSLYRVAAVVEAEPPFRLPFLRRWQVTIPCVTGFWLSGMLPRIVAPDLFPTSPLWLALGAVLPLLLGFIERRWMLPGRTKRAQEQDALVAHIRHRLEQIKPREIP